mgnify:CR=1 FL=1
MSYADKLQKASYAALQALVINGPPIPPIVDVVPYYQVNDKVLFLFQKPEGVAKIALKSGMKEEYKKTFEFQQKVFGSGITAANVLKSNEMFFGCRPPMHAKVDICPIKDFVVYRISNGRPSSFDNFGEPYAVVPFEKAFFIDSVEPNKQYYYVFRARADSGPAAAADYESFVEQFYLVELRQEAGLILPNIETFKFEESIRHKKSIKFNKRLKIKPAFLQSAPNKEKQDLGFENKSAFIPTADDTGKSKEFPKWKFRIISNSTQRKIDINVFYRKGVTLIAIDPAAPSAALRKTNLRRDIKTNKYEKILTYNVE